MKQNDTKDQYAIFQGQTKAARPPLLLLVVLFAIQGFELSQHIRIRSSNIWLFLLYGCRLDLQDIPALTVMASINCSLQEEVPTTRDTLAFFSNLSTTFCNQVKHNLNLNGLNMITINCFTMDCIFKALISRKMICHWSQSKLDNFHHKFSLYRRWTHFLTSFTILTLNYHYSVHENFSWQDSDISYPKLSSLWWSRTLFL